MIELGEVILFVLGIIIPIIIEHKYRFIRNIYLFLKMYFSRPMLMQQGYYSHEFVKKKIESSDKIIRVICVRNTRITEPDITEELKNFILKRDGLVEILTLSPEVPDILISEIMYTLPKPPHNIQQFRDDVINNRNYIFNLYNELGEKGTHLCYFEYKTLPLIHMCQFDDTIYLGFQLYHKDQVAGSLLDYCIEIYANSNLGKKIVEQFEYLKDKKSNKITNNTKPNQQDGTA